MNIVFIGGGNAAKELMELFIGDTTAKILYVVDLQHDAPGMKYARNHGIATSSNMEEVIKRMDVQVIMEVTGNGKVRKQIIEHMREDQDVVTADAAKMIYSLMCRQSAGKNTQIANEILKLSSQLGKVIHSIDKTSSEIKRILNVSQIISLNTQIEAAHIGEQGKTFRVIGERLLDMFEDIKNALGSINESSEEGHKTLKLFEDTEKALRNADDNKTFHDRKNIAIEQEAHVLM